MGCGRCLGVCPKDAICSADDESADILNRKIAEYTKAVVDGRPCFHIALALDLSPNCDCHSENDAPIAPDVGMTFNVSGNKLNAILNQRSQDMITANNWNTVQSALIVYSLSAAYGFIPGELVHVIANAHVYDRHIELAKELIENQQYDSPTLTVDPNVKDFYAFTKESFRLENYRYSEFNHKIAIAI